MPDMSPFELRTLAEAKFGKARWLVKLAAETGVNVPTVERWARGEWRITEKVATHVRAVCS